MSQAIHSVFASAPTLDLKRGRAVFAARDNVTRMFLVAKGAIVLHRHTATGTTVILQRAGPGSVLAEASAYARNYHCDALAVTDAAVRSVSLSAFRRALASDTQLAEAWAAHLAQAVQSARLRAEIRTLRTVAERLDAWLGVSGTLPPKGRWQDIAAELGVTREALYREIGRRRITDG